MRCLQLSDKAQTYKAYEIAYTSTLVDLKNDFELTRTATSKSKATASTSTWETTSFTAMAKRCGRLSLR